MLLNRCVNPEDEEGPGDIFELQHNLQMSLIKYDIFILYMNSSAILNLIKFETEYLACQLNSKHQNLS